MMRSYQRIFLIVIDSLGISGAPDAACFHDEGADTLGHIAQRHVPLHIPNLCRLGIANLRCLPQLPMVQETLGCYARLLEVSAGKDTMSGHWEMMGLPVRTPFRTFTDTGFPQELIAALSRCCDDRRIIGNKAASGTEILDELGEQEIRNGDLIVYTSADSVLQICGNEETMGLDTLYRYCEAARALTMKDEWRVGRVIARPYRGMRRGEFVRTANRHDYAIKPYGRTVLDELSENGYDVIGIGKISDIFSGQGITKSIRSASSVEGMRQTIALRAGRTFHGLCFRQSGGLSTRCGVTAAIRSDTAMSWSVSMCCWASCCRLLRSRMICSWSALTTAMIRPFAGSDHTRESCAAADVFSLRCASTDCWKAGATFADIGATIAENFQVLHAGGDSRQVAAERDRSGEDE